MILEKPQFVQNNRAHAVKNGKVNQSESTHCCSLTNGCWVTQTITELFLTHADLDIRLYMFVCMGIHMHMFTPIYNHIDLVTAYIMPIFLKD